MLRNFYIVKNQLLTEQIGQWQIAFNPNHEIFEGHFPGNPVVPGVILCEIMAQSCCLLIGDELKGKTPFYAGIEKVRFKKQVKPGDLIEIKARILSRRNLAFFVETEAKVKGELSARGTLSFVLIENEKLSINQDVKN